MQSATAMKAAYDNQAHSCNKEKLEVADSVLSFSKQRLAGMYATNNTLPEHICTGILCHVRFQVHHSRMLTRKRIVGMEEPE